MSTVLILQANGMQFISLLRVLAICGALYAVVLAFRPLLVGIGRAAWLVLFPRLSREQLAQRAHMRDHCTVERLIEASTGPSQTAELRAMAARD